MVEVQEPAETGPITACVDFSIMLCNPPEASFVGFTDCGTDLHNTITQYLCTLCLCCIRLSNRPMGGQSVAYLFSGQTQPRSSFLMTGASESNPDGVAPVFFFSVRTIRDTSRGYITLTQEIPHWTKSCCHLVSVMTEKAANLHRCLPIGQCILTAFNDDE